MTSVSSNPQVVKSIQQFNIALNSGVTTQVATITSVQTAKSVVIVTGVIYDGSATYSTDNQALGSYMCDATLTNSTTVTARHQTANGNGQINVKGQVLEYK